MAEVTGTAGYFTGLFTGEVSLIFTLAFFAAVIVIYGIFVFYFYRYLAKKNLIELNLSQYNTYSHPAMIKTFASIFYIIEYIIILPVITFFWFAVLAILILLLGEGMDVGTILLISAALVAAVRITAYISENLSRDLAKMLPFTLLAIAITKPGFFEVSELISRFSGIPNLLSHILYYLLFIITIEITMRIIDFFTKIFKTTKEEVEETETE